ncbi:MAG TPA: hypothetical protein DCS93_27575 [Microscillaceae bacterium]|nr:hypothetical protein [Microscillaceae bacterium]
MKMEFLKQKLAKKHYYRCLCTLLLFSITTLQAQNQTTLQRKITLQRTKGTVKEFLNDLIKYQKINLIYDENIIPDKELNFYKKNWDIQDFLQHITRLTNLEWTILNGYIILKRPKKNNKNKATLNGIITGKSDGEYLIGATVYVKELDIGAIANAYGFYSLTVPSGNYTFIFSYIGHQPYKKKLALVNDTWLDVKLTATEYNLQQIEIIANREEDIECVETVQMSAHSMEVNQIKNVPMLAGEADILKTIQFLPGIQNANQGTANFSVRGGSYDQNLILLDEAPVYNVSHAMGFFSVFNIDAVKDIDIYKGAIPARYGGRLSSVIDIHMKEGNSQKLSVSGGLGLTASRLTVESPIGGKASFLLSGRYGYLGYTANRLARLATYFAPQARNFGRNNEIDFYDLNAKINVRLNKNNKVYLSAYTGQDHFFNDVFFVNNQVDWGNQTATFRWNHIFNPRLFGNFTFIYSNFHQSLKRDQPAQNYQWLAGLKQQGFKLDLNYFSTANHQIDFGLALTHHQFSPGEINPLNDSSAIQPITLDPKRAIETGIYLSHQWQLSSRLRLNYGVRLSTFHNIGPGTQYLYDQNLLTTGTQQFGVGELMTNYWGVEPRIAGRYLFTPNISVKASYNRTYQYLHLVTNSSAGLPTDVWLPVDNNIKPRFTDQIALGYFQNFSQKRYGFSIEIYHKWTNRVIDYKDNANLFLNKNIETQIRTGQGKAYGIELLFEKKKGRLTGGLSYTLATVEQTIPGVNNGQRYHPMHDRRHNLSLMTTYRLGKRWQISANYAYISSAGITVAEGIFASQNQPYNYYSARNAYRLPAFHQLDLSFKWQSNPKKRWRGEWAFGVTNAYNRKNTFTFFIDQPRTNTSTILKSTDLTTKRYKMYLLGLMPFATYNFKF